MKNLKLYKKSIDTAKQLWYIIQALAGVAQLVEQLICNQQVGGSSPSTSSIVSMHNQIYIWGISRVAKGDRL